MTEAFGGRLEPGSRPVVLAVDMMRAYWAPASPLCLPGDAGLRAAATVIRAARAAGVPVIHTRVAYAEDGSDGGLFVRKVPALRVLFGDGPLAQPDPRVAPEPGEVVVVKRHASAFFGTGLADTLRDRGVDTVVVVGVSTSGCVRATAVDAVAHGFVPLVVREAVGDRAPGPHEAALADLAAKYAEVVGDAEAIAYLGGVR
ncbi:MAG: isochorismatase family protein [Dermatophilaceae bacterium]